MVLVGRGDTDTSWPSVKVHRAVFLTLCHYLPKALHDLDDPIVVFPDVPIEVIRSLVQLLYTGVCSLTPKAETVAIMDLAHSLGLFIKVVVNSLPGNEESEIDQRSNNANEALDDATQDINSNVIVKSLTKKKIKVEDAKFSCEHCEFVCKFWSQMEHHANTVHSEKKFQCKKCDFETSRLKNVKKHDKHIHVGKGSLICDVCGFKSNDERKLTWHKNFLHKGLYKQVSEVRKMKKTVSEMEHQLVNEEKQVIKVEMQVDKVGKQANKVKKFGSLTSKTLRSKVSSNVLHCHVCDFKTFYEKSLKKHILRFHESEKVV